MRPGTRGPGSGGHWGREGRPGSPHAYQRPRADRQCSIISPLPETTGQGAPHYQTCQKGYVDLLNSFGPSLEKEADDTVLVFHTSL